VRAAQQVDQQAEPGHAAGDRYDAAVREVWAQIPRDLGTREAWALARPGMVAAQRRLDQDLAAARAEGGRTAQQVVTAQADTGMTADHIEASAERVLADRHAAEASATSAAFYGEYDRAGATLTRELREMEAGA
jgi:hypothetical protein